MLLMYSEKIRILGTASDVSSGYNLIKSTSPDIVFLDIKMPGGTGFQLLRNFKSVDFRVIFITAYEHYAVQAFRFSALDYLLKPIDPDLLTQTLENAKDVLDRENLVLKLKALEENIQLNDKPKKIIFKTADSIYLKNTDEIICLNSDGSYTEVMLTDGSRLVVSKSLKDIDDMLCDFGFIRIHKSHTININHLVRFIKADGGSVIMKNGVQLPVSQRKKEFLINKLEKL